jgi:CRISPR system Cascade subunit CasA
MIKPYFNLIDEPWIPIADVGRVSLRQIFSVSSYLALGGNPVQKIAITKLLLAIAQAAYTPKDDDEWQALGAEGVAKYGLAYLDKWHDYFYLYGEKPFLQMPQIINSTTQSFGAVLPEIATGNTTVLNSIQTESQLSDADKAILIVQLMGFGLGGKKTDNAIVLSTGYLGKTNDKGKPATGKPGVSLGFMGFLHNFLIGEKLLDTLWLNLFTQEQIISMPYKAGLGEAPWEKMPDGEQCEKATQLQQSLMGRLIPLSRFCLLNDAGLHYSEGIAHQGYKEGMVDPSVAVNFSGKDAKALWVDTERRPWRFLTAMLSFMSAGGSGFDCYHLMMGLPRARRTHLINIGLWSGGLRVSSNAGEQYCSGSDDFVESVIFIKNEYLGEHWYHELKQEMIDLDQIAKQIYGATMGYFKSQKSEGKNEAAQASHLFWQLAERQFQSLINACGVGKEQTHPLRHKFAHYANTSYNTYCPKDTARQLDAWAANLPNLNTYLKKTKLEANV